MEVLTIISAAELKVG